MRTGSLTAPGRRRAYPRPVVDQELGPTIPPLPVKSGGVAPERARERPQAAGADLVGRELAMLQAGSQVRESPLSLQGLAEEPQGLERGLKVLDVALRLSPTCVADLVLRDQSSRPVVVLGEGNDGPEALLGRAFGLLAEVRRMRDLLGRLFRQEGVSFAADPRVILVARRFSDALLAARDLLAPSGIELVEAHEVPIDGTHRLVVVRAGGASATGAPPASDPPAAAAVATAAATNSAAAPVAAEPKPAARGTNGNGNGSHAPPRPSLADEAKKKILRISDDIEEEVDGAVARFRLHDESIAVLEQGSQGCSISVGDAPDRRRTLSDRADLDAAIDDVVRRYFTLARQFAAKPPAARRSGAAAS